jgi:hypothetical protein
MLEAVVEDDRVAAESRDGDACGVRASLAVTTGSPERIASSTASSPPSAGSTSGWPSPTTTTRACPSHTPRDEAHTPAAAAERVREPERGRCLARATDRQVADADHGRGDPLARKPARS